MWLFMLKGKEMLYNGKQYTDLELVKLCAEAMELEFVEKDKNDPFYFESASIMLNKGGGMYTCYWPIDNDEQAFALMKRFKLIVDADNVTAAPPRESWDIEIDENLNRAIVMCVVKMFLTNKAVKNAG